MVEINNNITQIIQILRMRNTGMSASTYLQRDRIIKKGTRRIRCAKYYRTSINNPFSLTHCTMGTIHVELDSELRVSIAVQ